ncbi:MAG: hypothetical protein FJ403_18235 [Verrucomicrobia bacterium]|nr:hypothetical protein [Verrucomicrobiota bacterium]
MERGDRLRCENPGGDRLARRFVSLPMNLKGGRRCCAALANPRCWRRSNAALPTQWFMGSMHEILFRRSLSPSDGERAREGNFCRHNFKLKSKMTKTIKQRLAEGQIVRVMSLGALASPKLIEVAGMVSDLHGLWIDQEHSAITHDKLELLIMACRVANLSAFVRIAPTDYPTVMRPMEAGAEGIMAAQIRNVEQVKQVVEWAKYPPLGTRGLFQANYEAGYGTADPQKHVEAANRDRWLCIQIETPEAVTCAEAIARVDGVDCLFVGPGDLACTLGVPGQVLHPKCIAALERVSAAAKAAGKPWSALVRGPEHAAKCRELGCQLFSFVADMDLIHRGFQATKKLYTEFF